jgi:hypothetical protein
MVPVPVASRSATVAALQKLWVLSPVGTAVLQLSSPKAKSLKLFIPEAV